jgi:hypothetical protein
MKIIKLLLLFLLAFPDWSFSQNIYVISSEGRVYCDGKLLKTGDKLTENLSVSFTSSNDKLYLLSPEKGNFMITPEKITTRNNQGWLITLKDAVIPENKFYQTASRGEEQMKLFNDVYDLMGFFRDKVMVIGEAKYAVNKDKIPLNKENYFEFRNLTHPDTKSLVYSQNETGFFTLGTNSSDEKSEERIEMSYIQSGKKSSIGSFRLIAKTESNVANELGQFFKYQVTMNPTLIWYEQILPYISLSYGNTNLGKIRDIVRNDLGISLQIRE